MQTIASSFGRDSARRPLTSLVSDTNPLIERLPSKRSQPVLGCAVRVGRGVRPTGRVITGDRNKAVLVQVSIPFRPEDSPWLRQG